MVVSKRAYTPPTYAHQNQDRHLYIYNTQAYIRAFTLTYMHA